MSNVCSALYQISDSNIYVLTIRSRLIMFSSISTFFGILFWQVYQVLHFISYQLFNLDKNDIKWKWFCLHPSATTDSFGGISHIVCIQQFRPNRAYVVSCHAAQVSTYTISDNLQQVSISFYPPQIKDWNLVDFFYKSKHLVLFIIIFWLKLIWSKMCCEF